jgi:D-Tyr-tRNAtyr deacylase
MQLIWDVNDEVDDGIVDNIRRGYMAIVGIENDGTLKFSLTPTGKARVEEMVADHA